MERIQPLCPIRQDAKCMGAPCAMSLRSVRDDGVWVFTCALAGVVIGMLMAPPKDITIGSGNNITAGIPEDEKEEEAAEEQDGE